MSAFRLAPRLLAMVTLTVLFGCGGGGSSDSSGGTAPKNSAASVTVSPPSAALSIGGTAQLTATTLNASGAVITGRTITWSSSAPTVATVTAGGTVTALAAGTTVINAVADGQVGSAVVTVTAPVATVTVAPASATIAVGATTTLTATARDASGGTLTGRAITWSTSAANIATVSTSGVVTGVAAGTATITAASEGRTGTAAVTVSGATAPACSATARTLTLGATSSGSLSSNDCKLSDGSYYQKWDLTLTSSTTVQIDLTSTVFDAYLFLFDANGVFLTQDDDGGGGSNSRITRTLPAGRYRIYVNTFNAGEVGNFTIAARTSNGACINVAALTSPATVNGTLSSTASCLLSDGSYADRYTLRPAAKTTYTIDLISSAFDAYLFARDTAGTMLAFDDNTGGGTNARLSLTVEANNTVTLYANSFLAAQTGAYRLTVSSASNACSTTRPLAIPQTINGTLTSADCLGGGGNYIQFYLLNLSATTSVRIDLTSAVFDAYLYLLDATTGAVIAQDDDSGGGTNARIVASLAAGSYFVAVLPYDPGATGAFTLSTQTATSATNVTLTVSGIPSDLTVGQTAQGVATVTGNANTAVTWTSSDATVLSVTATGLVRGLIEGTATITATSVADASKITRLPVRVNRGTGTATQNLSIHTVYPVQSVQSSDGRVPLVANRTAMVRVFVRGGLGISAQKVRVRAYNGGVLLGTYTGTATPTLTLDQSASTSADIILPANIVQPGLRLVSDVDPDNTYPETNETDNAFPTDGSQQAITVNTVRDFAIQLIPVRFVANGRVGAVYSQLLDKLKVIWPLSTVNGYQHAQYTTNLPALKNMDQNGSWSTLLGEIEVLRRAENSSAYYYGMLNLDYTSGIYGLGYISGKSAIGADFSNASAGAWTLAHELGHNFSRLHAPCGVGANQPANPDPNYPYSNGVIGVYGIDQSSANARILPTATDLMTYCNNKWVSAYNYQAVMNYRATTSGTVASASSAVIVRGEISPSGITLAPAFTMPATVDANDPAGTHLVEGFAADGAVLFRQRFTPTLESSDDRSTRGFVTAVPYSPAAGASPLDHIVVRALNGTGGSAERRRPVAMPGMPGMRASDGPPVRPTRGSGNTVRLQWDGTAHPAILVRDRLTGEVLTISDSGDASFIPGRGDSVEIVLSDGVTTTRQIVELKSVKGAP